MPRQYRRKVSLETSYFVSLAFFDFLIVFKVCFVYLSLEMLHTLLFPLFLGPVFLVFSKTCVVVFFLIFDLDISQNGSCFLLLVNNLTFSGSCFRKRSKNSGERLCVSSFEVDVDGPGEPIDVFGGSLLLLEAVAATRGVDLSVT